MLMHIILHIIYTIFTCVMSAQDDTYDVIDRMSRRNTDKPFGY